GRGTRPAPASALSSRDRARSSARPGALARRMQRSPRRPAATTAVGSWIALVRETLLDAAERRQALRRVDRRLRIVRDARDVGLAGLRIVDVRDAAELEQLHALLVV